MRTVRHAGRRALPAADATAARRVGAPAAARTPARWPASAAGQATGVDVVPAAKAIDDHPITTLKDAARPFPARRFVGEAALIRAGFEAP
jgi:hypothetical protein